jgi:predicted nucleic acid-binding protein
MYVLDTNVISELRHGKPNQSLEVRAWAADKPGSHLFISAISILELEKGVLALERRTPPQGSALRIWLNGVKANFADRILPFSGTTATLCASPSNCVLLNLGQMARIDSKPTTKDRLKAYH